MIKICKINSANAKQETSLKSPAERISCSLNYGRVAIMLFIMQYIHNFDTTTLR